LIDRVPIHVAVAVVTRDDGRVLLARRADHLHQGGLWEFPGGKLEPGETLHAALRRELEEELGIEVRASEPLIRVNHRYASRAVLLDVHRVTSYRGTPAGREGQPIEWVDPRDFRRYPFPEADRPIISALRLPDTYLITGEPSGDRADFLERLERALRSGIRLLQLRAKRLDAGDYERLATAVIPCCSAYGARVMLHGTPARVERLGAHGLHLTALQLMAANERPLPGTALVSASCHNAQELAKASALGLDFAVLSPVRRTLSHPQAEPLGWERFFALVDRAALPVYALGGMRPEHLRQAKRSGAQGIAGIRGLWDGG
jgi:8-oxo-dGTP diphosphatase